MTVMECSQIQLVSTALVKERFLSGSIRSTTELLFSIICKSTGQEKILKGSRLYTSIYRNLFQFQIKSNSVHGGEFHYKKFHNISKQWTWTGNKETGLMSVETKWCRLSFVCLWNGVSSLKQDRFPQSIWTKTREWVLYSSHKWNRSLGYPNMHPCRCPDQIFSSWISCSIFGETSSAYSILNSWNQVTQEQTLLLNSTAMLKPRIESEIASVQQNTW